jgi:pyruvate dehydrogenase (quinone)
VSAWATSGPGATHLITGMYDARLDHTPLLAIAGQQARAALGGHYQQEVDLASAYKDVAGGIRSAGKRRAAGAPSR